MKVRESLITSLRLAALRGAGCETDPTVEHLFAAAIVQARIHGRSNQWIIDTLAAVLTGPVYAEAVGTVRPREGA